MEYRVRLHSRLNGCAFPRPSSGSHSHQSSNDNDSGVALLLEKAHVTNPFQPLLQGPDSQDAGGSRTHEPSDLASFANHSANANVQEYLNTLQQEGSGGNGHLGSRGNSNPEMVPGKYSSLVEMVGEILEICYVSVVHDIQQGTNWILGSIIVIHK